MQQILDFMDNQAINETYTLDNIKQLHNKLKQHQQQYNNNPE